MSVPVAGHMPAADRRDLADVGDAEQLPAGLCTIGDYDVLSALVAPRPVLFIFNRYDDCCFQPHKAASGTYEAARGAYELLGAADRCALHIGTDAGHNYDEGNRLQFYAWVNRHFGLDTPDQELPYRGELYHERDLWVGLPAERRRSERWRPIACGISAAARPSSRASPPPPTSNGCCATAPAP